MADGRRGCVAGVGIHIGFTGELAGQNEVQTGIDAGSDIARKLDESSESLFPAGAGNPAEVLVGWGWDVGRTWLYWSFNLH